MKAGTSSRRPRSASILIATAALALAVTWWIWAPMLGLELLGWDSYPLIAASRIESARDVLGVFGDELMDGRYPLGRYWRPLVELCFAGDFARSGLDPRGYHATDLTLIAACAVALAWLALELGACKRWSSAGACATVAALAFVAQPVLYDVLPAPARRADTLALLFTALALATQRAGGWRALTAVFVAFALASKETGAVALPAVIALAAWSSNAAGWSARGRALVRATWPSLVAVGLVLALRTAVLGGLGGGRESSLANALARTPQALLDGLIAAFAPRDASYVALPLIVGLGLGSAACVLIARAERRSDETPAPSFARTAGVLVTWTVLIAVVTSLSGVERGWYELPFAGVRSVWVALLVGRAVELARSRAWRVTAAVPLGLASVIVALDVAYLTQSSVMSDVASASAKQRDFLERFERDVRAAQPGARVVAHGFPMEMPSSSAHTRGTPRTITMLAPYSLEAYAELAIPERKVRLEYPGSRSMPPRADEVVVVLAR